MYSYYMLLLLFVLVSDRSVSKPHCVKAAQTVCAWEEGWKSERKGSKAQRSDVLYIYTYLLLYHYDLLLFVLDSGPRLSKPRKLFAHVGKRAGKSSARQLWYLRAKLLGRRRISNGKLSALETARKTQNQQRKTQLTRTAGLD